MVSPGIPSFIRTVLRLRADSASEAEDMFQELFLSLILRPPPADVQNMRGYLYRVIMNDLMNRRREREAYQRYLQRYRDDLGLRDGVESPDRSATEKEDAAMFMAFLCSHLQRREAEVMVMRYSRGYSIAEVAEKTGLGKRTVSRYLSSGLRRLWRQLGAQ